MTATQTLRCKLGRHRWGPVQGGVHEALQTCTACGKTRALSTGEPPEGHDHLDIHR